MTNPTKQNATVSIHEAMELHPHDDLGSVTVSPVGFAKFDLEMSRQLETLIGRWAPNAAPCDSNFGRKRNSR